jgi:Ca2+ transporting ATPase
MLYFEQGPKMSFNDLQNHLSCPLNTKFANGYTCEVMEDLRPKTISLSILVLVEMFNALNAISENESLLQMPPWVNPWLIIAICFSMAQHVFILSFSYFQGIFQVKTLSADEWMIVLVCSFPVIVLDECLKIYSRHIEAREDEEKKNV